MDFDAAYQAALVANALWDKRVMTPEQWTERCRTERREAKKRWKKTPGGRKNQRRASKRQNARPEVRRWKRAKEKFRSQTDPEYKAKKAANSKARSQSPMAKAVRAAMNAMPEIQQARRKLNLALVAERREAEAADECYGVLQAGIKAQQEWNRLNERRATDVIVVARALADAENERWDLAHGIIPDRIYWTAWAQNVSTVEHRANLRARRRRQTKNWRKRYPEKHRARRRGWYYRHREAEIEKRRVRRRTAAL